MFAGNHMFLEAQRVHAGRQMIQTTSLSLTAQAAQRDGGLGRNFILIVR
jgi:hypothetical protein